MPAPDETFPFINRSLTQSQSPCKGNSTSFFSLRASRELPHNRHHPPKRGAVSATDVAMQQVPADIWAAFERRLDQAQVPADQRPDYHKWVRFYFDFCHKYGHSPTAPTSLSPFMSARLPSHAPGLLLSFLRGQQNNAISLTDPFTTDSVAKQSTGNHASIILT